MFNEKETKSTEAKSHMNTPRGIQRGAKDCRTVSGAGIEVRLDTIERKKGEV